MSSLLVWARQDNTSQAQWQQFARGDVIDLQEDDNFHWGNAIMGPDCLGWWRVVVVSGVPVKSLQGLVMGDGATVPDGAPYRIRTCRIDLDALEAAEGRALFAYEMLVIDYATLLSAISEKLVRPFDASVIGFAPTTIG